MMLYPSPRTPADVRRSNRYAVLSLLRDYGALSKSELVELTDLTNTTITTILDDLMVEGLVRPVEESEQNRGAEASRGRPAAVYSLDNERWRVAGLQIASDTITSVMMNLSGDVLEVGRLHAPVEMPIAEVLDSAASLLAGLIQRAVHGRGRLLGIGVALEGLVDVNAGLSLWMLLRDNWNNVPIREFFESRFALPVFVDYRVYAAALAESYYGAAKGVSDFAYLNVDTGIAVASVASGTLVRSSAEPGGITGGLGHVMTAGGHRQCYCGSVGCLQTEITTQALLTQVRELLAVSHRQDSQSFWQSYPLTFDSLIAAVHQNEPLALHLRDRFAANLGIAVRGATLLYSANKVIMGGAAIRFGGDEALNSARRAVRRLSLLHQLFQSAEVVASSLLPDSATVGAATLVIQAVMDGQITASVGG